LEKKIWGSWGVHPEKNLGQEPGKKTTKVPKKIQNQVGCGTRTINAWGNEKSTKKVMCQNLKKKRT